MRVELTGRDGTTAWMAEVYGCLFHIYDGDEGAWWNCVLDFSKDELDKVMAEEAFAYLTEFWSWRVVPAPVITKQPYPSQ